MWTRSGSWPSETADPARDAEAAFTEALEGLSAAARAEPVPVDPHAVWLRLDAGLQGQSGEKARTQSGETTKVAQSIVSRFRSLALLRSLREPFSTWRPVLAARRRAMLALTAAACVAGGLVWMIAGPAPEMERVRIDASLWQRDPVAEEPMGETTDALIALLGIEES